MALKSLRRHKVEADLALEALRPHNLEVDLTLELKKIQIRGWFGVM